MELSKIVNAYEALNSLRATNTLPFTLAWKVSDLMDLLEKHYKRFQDERQKIIMQYGNVNGDDSYSVPQNKVKDFRDAIEKILVHNVKLEFEPELEYKDFVDAKIVITKETDFTAIRPFVKKRELVKEVAE